MRALIVEDDGGVATFIRRGLEDAEFTVDLAADGECGLTQASGGAYDVIVLDLMLPERDGFSVLRSLRERGVTTPIVCLTARDAVDDRVRGLNAGADDYLVKPFVFAELLARIRAIMRRGQSVLENPLVVGDLTLDVMGRAVERGGQRIDLSSREFSLLECLIRNAGEVVSRSMILQRVWHIHHDPHTNVVDVHINRLRRKVDGGFDRPLIHTVRGSGYVIKAG